MLAFTSIFHIYKYHLLIFSRIYQNLSSCYISKRSFQGLRAPRGRTTPLRSFGVFHARIGSYFRKLQPPFPLAAGIRSRESFPSGFNFVRGTCFRGLDVASSFVVGAKNVNTMFNGNAGKSVKKCFLCRQIHFTFGTVLALAVFSYHGTIKQRRGVKPCAASKQKETQTKGTVENGDVAGNLGGFILRASGGCFGVSSR